MHPVIFLGYSGIVALEFLQIEDILLRTNKTNSDRIDVPWVPQGIQRSFSLPPRRKCSTCKDEATWQEKFDLFLFLFLTDLLRKDRISYRQSRIDVSSFLMRAWLKYSTDIFVAAYTLSPWMWLWDKELVCWLIGHISQARPCWLLTFFAYLVHCLIGGLVDLLTWWNGGLIDCRISLYRSAFLKVPIVPTELLKKTLFFSLADVDKISFWNSNSWKFTLKRV